MELSVAICTYKRPQLLREALRSLELTLKLDCRWELLVIDNAVEPEVERLVNGFAPSLPMRYVAEPKGGTGHARNRAIAEARAKVILFTDDDVTLDRLWLVNMQRAIDENPEYDFWGGKVEPVHEGAYPPWFDLRSCPMLGDSIVRYELGAESRPWVPRRDAPFCTANLALRVEAVRKAGGFQANKGHLGRYRKGNEDTLMVRSLQALGRRGWYVADAIVCHPVPADRLTRPYARSFAWRQGWLSVQISREEGKVPRWLYRRAGEQAVRGLGRMIWGGLHGDPAESFAGNFDVIYNCSKLWHSCRPA